MVASERFMALFPPPRHTHAQTDAALGRRIGTKLLLGAAPGHSSNPQTIMASLSVRVAAVVTNATGFIPLFPIL